MTFTVAKWLEIHPEPFFRRTIEKSEFNIGHARWLLRTQIHLLIWPLWHFPGDIFRRSTFLLIVSFFVFVICLFLSTFVSELWYLSMSCIIICCSVLLLLLLNFSIVICGLALGGCSYHSQKKKFGEIITSTILVLCKCCFFVVIFIFYSIHILSLFFSIKNGSNKNITTYNARLEISFSAFLFCLQIIFAYFKNCWLLFQFMC